MLNQYKQEGRFNFLYELERYNIEPYLINKGREILSRAGKIAKNTGLYISACFMFALTIWGALA